MAYRYAHVVYDSPVRDDGTEVVDPERNVNPSMLMEAERSLLREERNTGVLRVRVLAEVAKGNGRG